MDIIASCAFGIDTNNSKEYDTPFKKYTKKFFEKTTNERLYELFTEAFPRFAKAMHMKAIDSDVSKFFHDFIKNSVSFREEHNYRRNDFLQLLIDMKSSDEVRNEGENFFSILYQISSFVNNGNTD